MSYDDSLLCIDCGHPVEGTSQRCGPCQNEFALQALSAFNKSLLKHFEWALKRVKGES